MALIQSNISKNVKSLQRVVCSYGDLSLRFLVSPQVGSSVGGPGIQVSKTPSTWWSTLAMKKLKSSLLGLTFIRPFNNLSLLYLKLFNLSRIHLSSIITPSSIPTSKKFIPASFPLLHLQLQTPSWLPFYHVLTHLYLPTLPQTYSCFPGSPAFYSYSTPWPWYLDLKEGKLKDLNCPSISNF